MELKITGASNFTRRMFDACGRFQWARELLTNSIEAGATRVEFGIEWQAVKKFGIYRRMVVDNGKGMGPQELLDFFSTLGLGDKKIEGVHDNFGVGAKIATLPWNPEGVVVISRKDGESSLICIFLNEETNAYELVDWRTDYSQHNVINPEDTEFDSEEDVDWAKVMPTWVGDNGTAVVLLGSKANKHTMLGNPDDNESDTKGLSKYLNRRFWEFPDIAITVEELRSSDPRKWPSGPTDQNDDSRPNRRAIEGAKRYVQYQNKKGQIGQLKSFGSIAVDQNRVKLNWFLWEGDRPNIHMYAEKGGYIALKYRNELYHLSTRKVDFRKFGITEAEVTSNLTIVIEPKLMTADSRWGIHPDQSRNTLVFTGNSEKGVSPPIEDWGAEFATEMPQEIRDAISEARKDGDGTITDDEYRKRLQDKFGSRWTIKTPVEKAGGRQQGMPTSEIEIESTDPNGVQPPRPPQPPTPDPDPEPLPDPMPKPTPKNIRKVRKKVANSDSDTSGTNSTARVDIPQYKLAKGCDFDTPWHLAAWMPHHPEGPTVLINTDSPILQEVVAYHQSSYPLQFAEDAERAIHRVFGEVAVSKIAHSQQLAAIGKLSEEQLTEEYRNEQSLTIALMGLLAEESLIVRRLAGLGKRKAA